MYRIYIFIALSGMFLFGSAGAKELQPNILLITIDALRADHLGCYGYSRETSPNMNTLANQSVLFENAFVPRGKTSPSFASMMTGLNPYQTGLREIPQSLKQSHDTLAERLKEGGYHTAAVIANAVLKASPSGFNQGFDDYLDDTPTPELNRPTIFEKRADLTTDQAIGWLQVNNDSPFFLWVHYMDPHGPYDPPEPYRSFFESTREQKISDLKNPFFAQHNLIPSVEYVEEYIDLYDGEIRFTDEQMGRLLSALGPLKENTFIVLTSDHGEGLGEHGYYFEHGDYAYDSVMRIPLLIHSPGQVESKRVKQQVSINDLFPTLLEWASQPSPENIDGISLQPWLKGEAEEYERPLYMEFICGKHFTGKGVRTRKWKYLATYLSSKKAVTQKELYFLENDPEEIHNVIQKHPDVAEVLENCLAEWNQQDLLFGDLFQEIETAKDSLDPEMERALKALGYLK